MGSLPKEKIILNAGLHTATGAEHPEGLLVEQRYFIHL